MAYTIAIFAILTLDVTSVVDVDVVVVVVVVVYMHIIDKWYTLPLLYTVVRQMAQAVSEAKGTR